MKYKSLLSLENQKVWPPWVLFAAKTVLLEPRRTLTDSLYHFPGPVLVCCTHSLHPLGPSRGPGFYHSLRKSSGSGKTE